MYFRLRPAELTDAAQLQPLLEQLGYYRSVEDIKMTLNAIHTIAGRVIVAVVVNPAQETTIIGCVNAFIDVRLASGASGEIASLVVLEKHRGMGIGKALITEAEQFLEGRCQRIRIRANATREQAHNFYGACGYRKQKVQKIFVKRLENT